MAECIQQKAGTDGSLDAMFTKGKGEGRTVASTQSRGVDATYQSSS
jgi:hypothetical protein